MLLKDISEAIRKAFETLRPPVKTDGQPPKKTPKHDKSKSPAFNGECVYCSKKGLIKKYFRKRKREEAHGRQGQQGQPQQVQTNTNSLPHRAWSGQGTQTWTSILRGSFLIPTPNRPNHRDTGMCARTFTNQKVDQ